MPGGCLHLKNILKRPIKLKCVGSTIQSDGQCKKKKKKRDVGRMEWDRRIAANLK